MAVGILLGIVFACGAIGGVATQQDKTDKKILILGAGMAGVSAARTLTDMGYTNFVILEGSSRAGGRVRHQKLGGHTLNMGPVWTRGEGSNPMFNMLLEYNISHTRTMAQNYQAFDTLGNDVTYEIDVIYEQEFVEAIDTADAIAMKAREENLPDFSLRAALLKGGWMASSPLHRALEYLEYDTKFGHSPDAISGKYAFYYEPQDEHYTDDTLNVVVDERGMTHIIDKFVEDAIQGNSDKLQLNKVVNKIEHTEDQVTVTTTNGEVFTGDYVIVTFSIGVLQHNEVEFIPHLPEWKMDAIQQFQMGLCTHIYLQFDEYFWDEFDSLLFVRDIDRYRLWTNFNLFIEDSNILMATVLAEDSSILEGMSETDVIDDVVQTLNDMYEHLDVIVPDPVDYIISNFTHDPFFYGAFSNWPPGFTEDSHLALQSRVGRVHFAGDYADVIHHGLLNGAYYSGIQTANDIMSCIQAGGQCGEDYTPLYESRGCTYSAAANYNATARVDDGSCIITMITCGSSPTTLPSYTLSIVAVVLLILKGD